MNKRSTLGGGTLLALALLFMSPEFQRR